MSGRGLACAVDVAPREVGAPDVGAEVEADGVAERDVLGVVLGEAVVRDALLEPFGWCRGSSDRPLCTPDVGTTWCGRTCCPGRCPVAPATAVPPTAAATIETAAILVVSVAAAIRVATRLRRRGADPESA